MIVIHLAVSLGAFPWQAKSTVLPHPARHPSWRATAILVVVIVVIGGGGGSRYSLYGSRFVEQ